MTKDKNYLTIALPKGKLGEDAIEMLTEAGYGMEGLAVESRKLLLVNEKAKICYIICRPTDIPTYVEYGAADIGIVGKDTIVEQDKDVFELVDMGFGTCRFVVAAPADKVQEFGKTGEELLRMFNYSRVATKFPKVAETFFHSKGMQVEVIELHGNIELAPVVGLSNMIVDIVSTGTTLKENKLVPVAEIFTASARLIANRVSFRMNHQRVQEIIDKLRIIIDKA